MAACPIKVPVQRGQAHRFEGQTRGRGKQVRPDQAYSRTHLMDEGGPEDEDVPGGRNEGEVET